MAAGSATQAANQAAYRPVANPGQQPYYGGAPIGQQGGFRIGTSRDRAAELGTPSGYRWDPVQNRYVQTGESIGKDQGAAISGLWGALPPSLTSLFSGGAGGGGFSASSGGGAGMPRETMSPFTPPATIAAPELPKRETYNGNAAQIAAIQGPNMDAANAAAYAGAKDRAGLETRGALTGLAGAMAGRGIVGSGVEGRGQSSVVNQGQQQLGAASREQAMNQAALAEQNALATYQGDITQRGQNLQNQQFHSNLDVTQRGQDISHLNAANQGLITQRGQDIGLGTAQYQGGITQRGQDLQAQQANQQLALQRQNSALQGLSSLRGMVQY